VSGREYRQRTSWILALLALVLAQVQAAESARTYTQVAADYVRLALAQNIALQSQRIDVERAESALNAAKARFFPELSLQGRYTRTEGGRTIELPLGTLLNPAYQTLNELLIAQGQTPRFGSLADESILFQRAREQDTRITLRQPLYQPALPAALRAQREFLRSSEYAQIALSQRVQRDVQVAYLGWLKTLRTRSILQSTAQVLAENLRVNDSLYRNGKVTQDQVLRAQAEQLAVTQQMREAQGAIDQSRSYLNFLLNRPLDTPLEDARLDAVVDPTNSGEVNAQDLRQAALASRPELSQMDAAIRAADAQQRVARAALKPSLSLGVDAGTQGEQYRLGPGYNFIAGSLVASWKFFDGGANRFEADRARLAARKARLQREELALQVQLEVQQAVDRLATSIDSLSVAQAREAVASAALRIASRKRDVGNISQVEFLDARSAFTSAELALNVTHFELLERQIELNYATGSATLPPLATYLETSR
jgi:outer membrane protein